MKIEYDPTLVEKGVFLAVRRNPKLEQNLHAAVDSLYETANDRERDAGFRRVYAEFFTRLGLHSIMSDLLDKYPLITNAAIRCLITEAPRSKAESAELFVRGSDGTATPADRTLIVQICPQSFLEPARLTSRMHRELLHVADMLDERFEYDREELQGFPSRRNLLRDRYRVLWDIYVEGRLNRSSITDEEWTERLKQMFMRAFNTGGCSTAFDRVYDSDRLTHAQLVRWAHDSESFLMSEFRPHAQARHAPGEPCFLCGFPTHDWFPFESEPHQAVADAIARSRPDWSSAKGACRQCAELYAVIAEAESTRARGSVSGGKGIPLP